MPRPASFLRTVLAWSLSWRRLAVLMGVLLVWLVALVGTTAAQSRHRDGAPRSGPSMRTDDRVRDHLDTTIAVTGGTTIDVSMASGRISVRGWDRQSVEVHAASESGEIAFSYAAPLLRLTSNVGRRVRGSAGDAVLELKVPRGSRVLTYGTTGDIAILDVGGEAEARTMRGNIDVRGVVGRTIVETMTGDLSLSGVEGAVRVTTLSGDLVLNDVHGDIDVGCTSGDVTMRGIRSTAVRVNATSAAILFDGTLAASGRYEFTTHSGDVQLYLAEGSRGTLDLQSFSGELRSRFPLTLMPSSTASTPSGARKGTTRDAALRQRQWFEFGGETGGGGASISISTFSGEINIDRGPSTGSGPVRKH